MTLFKKSVTNLLLVIAGSVFALVIVELGVRSLDLYRFPTDRFVEPHPELGWAHIPNKEGYWAIGKDRVHIKINSKGLRDREYAYEKQEGVFRVLVLGDSFTEGFQVPLGDTFSKRLEYELNKRRSGFEVINAGFAGVGTDYELLFFKREGYKYHPDLVLVAFFQNDVYDNYKSRAVINRAGSGVAYEKRGFIEDFRKFLAARSCAYNYFGYVIPAQMPWVARVLMNLGFLSFQPIDEAQQLGQQGYIVLAKEYGPEWREAWSVTQIMISELKEEAERHGSNAALVSIPFREQVIDSEETSAFPDLATRRLAWDMEKPDKILEGLLADIGLPFFPLLHPFRKAEEESDLYYVNDGHWNVQGHHLAAVLIYDWLVRESLVPVEAE